MQKTLIFLFVSANQCLHLHLAQVQVSASQIKFGVN
jgi:hypothetical protein